MNQKQAFTEKLKQSWPSPIVARQQVAKFTGGMLSARTLANIDSDRSRNGPQRIKWGRIAAYDRDSLIDWLVSKMDFAADTEEQASS